MQISLNELKKQKTSNRIYILGSGKSILDISILSVQSCFILLSLNVVPDVSVTNISP